MFQAQRIVDGRCRPVILHGYGGAKKEMPRQSMRLWQNLAGSQWQRPWLARRHPPPLVDWTRLADPSHLVPRWVGGWGPRYLAEKRERGPVRVPSSLTEDYSQVGLLMSWNHERTWLRLTP